jgi:hypothetical protein
MGSIGWLLESSPWIRQGVIVLAAVACGACIFYVVKRVLAGIILGRPVANRTQALADLNKMILMMSRMLQILDTQSKEYFATLHENGLSEILRIHDSLLIIVSDLSNHLEEGRFEQFDALHDFVTRPGLVRHEAQLATGIDLNPLLDWTRLADRRCHELIDALMIAQKQTEAARVSRPHKAIPTLVALKELRGLLKTNSQQDLPESEQPAESPKIDRW